MQSTTLASVRSRRYSAERLPYRGRAGSRPKHAEQSVYCRTLSSSESGTVPLSSSTVGNVLLAVPELKPFSKKFYSWNQYLSSSVLAVPIICFIILFTLSFIHDLVFLLLMPFQIRLFSSLYWKFLSVALKMLIQFEYSLLFSAVTENYYYFLE